MHDFDKEFDLKLRSMLDGVEEEVPQRVWEGVSSRIGRRTAPVAWMRWAGASLAAAAAVALAVVLAGTFKGSSESLMPQESLVAEVQAPSAVTSGQEEEVSGQETEIPQTISSATTRKAPRYAHAGKTAAAEDIAETEEAGEAKTVTAEQTSVPEQESAKPAETSQKKESKTRGWDDPFARMAYEDAHARSSVKLKSVGFGGLLGTNDGAKPGSHGAGMMGASSTHNSKVQKVITEDGESTYGVPASLGLGIRLDINDRWSVGTGVNYSQLTRSFDGVFMNYSTYHDDNSGPSLARGRARNNVQYIGIPVNVYYNVISNDVFDFYTFAGGSVEKCISNRYRMPVDGRNETLRGDIKGLQYSAALGMGVQFNLTDHAGLYIDPSARYWMGKNQPKSIRTQQPFMFNIELGLRFEL